MPLLEINAVNVFYDEFHTLKDISIDVSEGEVVAVVGANSAGKTTLLNTVSGVYHPSSGEISFQSTPITGLETHEIAKLGLIQVPEGRRIFPFMSIIDNLKAGSTLERARLKRKQSLEFAFSLFPVLKNRSKQLGGTLSGGEQQMLAIARGLMALPKMLMLDEPSTGLSPLFVENIFKAISQIKIEGISILLVEQNVQKTLGIATRGYVLEGGTVRMKGAGKDLLANPYIKEAYLGL
jgi:branched-chain amino acid transport system ATP-binding protein